MTKKQNLIKALKTAIHALEHGTVHYEWAECASCNCGVVVQAMLGKTTKQISKMLKPMTHHHVFFKRGPQTWRQMVQRNCSITGESTVEIFKKLNEAGMSAEDICHLEFMSNEAILARAGIYKSGKHHADKGNLIRYLKAWTVILQEKEADDTSGMTKMELQNELVKAVTDDSPEGYKKAAKLRDKIAVM
jgi:hypothetical protein